jgi:cell wall-associated NlpC family hydrolase
MKNSVSVRQVFCIVAFISTVYGCADGQNARQQITPENTEVNEPVDVDSILDTPGQQKESIADIEIHTGNIHPDSIVAFARTLIGTPYLYASADPAKGFDCSGFITYVFNHFHFTIPRSSVDFTHYGRDIQVEQSKPGDLILFTGTDSTVRVVGHMGIVESIKSDTLHFIHSTSGKQKGVVITPLGKYYRSRFVKVIRVFPDQLFQ